MARKKQFKAESQRLLDLMIHSIYTNKEIFLRELISNASDANDKLYFKALEDGSITLDRDALTIDVSANPETRELVIKDHGIGMNDKDLEAFLGTIAKSDSFAFKEALDSEDSDVIGQFGVGFYSAFMVSDSIEVISRAFGEEQGYRFVSNGLDGYTIEAVDVAETGTTVICHIKPDDEENYDQYLNTYTLQRLIKQYSDYIRYPIRLERVADFDDDDSGVKKGEVTVDVVNSMIPIWKRSNQETTEDDLNAFYMDKFHDYEAPLKTIKMKVEGNPSFDALLYIPQHAPQNFYSANYETGLQLYSRGVFIMEHNKALVPEYFRFVKGLVDSPDLSLNISREILQQDRQLSAISKRIERKIKTELEKMLRDDREQYETFWEAFKMPIKIGVYDNFGMHKETLQDLLMFRSSSGALTTLNEYVERMQESQDTIYYVAGATVAKCEMVPQAEYVKSKGYEVLYFTDDIDEFAIQVLNSYKEKPFKSVTQGDLDLQDDEEKEALNARSESAKDVLGALKDALAGRVTEVRLSKRLVSQPVCLVSDEGLSLEMERILSQMPDAEMAPKANRILEINPDHEILSALEYLEDTESDQLEAYALLLYDQACLLEGLPLEDLQRFSTSLAQLMVHAAK